MPIYRSLIRPVRFLIHFPPPPPLARFVFRLIMARAFEFENAFEAIRTSNNTEKEMK
jgi:hypothetical protein